MDDAPEHYFTARPATPAERRTLNVRIAGNDVTVEVASGIFSPGRLDLGTQVLLRSVPPLAPGTGDGGASRQFLDLGCGWGPIALTMASQAPDAAVWAVDVNGRSLDLTRRNAERLGLTNVHAVGPDEVPADIRFDAVWSNPPIRVGKDVLHEMLTTWLARLAPGGEAHLVVQRNLGADSLMRWMNENLTGVTTTKLASAKGFRVLHTARPIGG